MIRILEGPTVETLDAECYLAANPDVAAASDGDDEEWARVHFDNNGQHEACWQGGRQLYGRWQYHREGLAKLQAAREFKLACLAERSPRLHARCGWLDYQVMGNDLRLLRASLADGLPVDSAAVSANYYDEAVDDFVASTAGLLLDLGAGYRHEYHEHVVNVEIDQFPSTDVLAWGTDLPFDDEVFDGAVCLAVLEHVEDPFAVARELVRVVRGGATIIVDWPFLQPEHGYPNHYFNATMEGARSTFERLDGVASVEAAVPLRMHPVFMLPWVLNRWLEGLPEVEREQFSQLTVGEIARELPHDLIRTAEWAKALSTDAQRIIAAGTRLRITRA